MSSNGKPSLQGRRCICSHLPRYDNLSLISAMGGESHFCRCAHAGCTSGSFFDPQFDNFFTCDACENQTCVSCDTLWHAGKTCETARQEREAERAALQTREEQMSREVLDRTTKLCPNEECGRRCTKISGCDHMRCKSILRSSLK